MAHADEEHRSQTGPMANKALVIVESPTKARTITKFLGKEYIVKASMGHVRDLPDSAEEIPAALKKQSWARLGVNVQADFEPLYIIPKEKREVIRGLQDAMKEASEIYLATDEDREGESISWHLFETLQPKVPTKRLVFHEITKDAILKALASARTIDENLVRAQETRRIVDRLFGYEVSPLLWKKMARGLSAGRVQSVAVRLLVERERERTAFRKASYWSLKGTFSQPAEQALAFEAELTHRGNERVATSKDFDPATGRLKSGRGAEDGAPTGRAEPVVVLSEKDVAALRDEVLKSTPQVISVDEKPYSSSPPAPFVTSTLQQEANAKLRFSAKYTMSIAQQLYENGFITYMRTDSTTLSEEALRAARSLIQREYGDAYLPSAPRVYATKVKNAQEAHEAIRPAGEQFTHPDTVRSQLGAEPGRLYELIWKRTVASQMENSRGTSVTVQIGCGQGKFRANGRTIEFPGFLRAYVEGAEDPDAELSDRERILPKLTASELLKVLSCDQLERTTQPPARYTEGTLIKELERRGIGRPSTWATIVELVLSRSYAFKKGNALVPTFVGIAVVGLLETHFANLLDYEFTARLEDDLDAISRGESGNISYLKTFYFGNGHPGLRPLVERGEAEIDPRVVCGIPIGVTASGETVEVRIGRYGPFLTNGTVRSSLPDGLTLEELTLEAAEALLRTAAKEPEALGNHPETGEPIFLKNGRFGPYLQLGEPPAGEKPKKMASLLPGMVPSEVSLDAAVQILALPRTVAKHPETGEDIIAANGRFGPYIKCGKETRSIAADFSSPIDITVEQALELLAQPKTRGRGAAAKPKTLREMGAHPVSQSPLIILSGRYGPYVTDGTVNASLPRGTEPAALTMDEAVSLLQARAERAPSKKGRKKGGGARAEKAPSKKAAKAEKSAAKPAAKKPAARGAKKKAAGAEDAPVTGSPK